VATLVLALGGVRLNVPWLLGGLLAGVLMYVPYLRGELANGWQNTRGMLGGQHEFSWDRFKALTTPLNLLVNFVPQWTRGASSAEYRELGRACFGWFGLCLAVNALSALVAVFLVVGAFLKFRVAATGFWHAPRAAFRRAPGMLFLAMLLLVPLLFALLVGQPFHARYALVLLPPLCALAGAGAARWQSPPRLGRFFTLALAVTTCANVWLMPAFYRHQGTQIERGEVFIPSFRQLEAVYQKLKAHAGQDRPVRVEATTYVQSLPASDKLHRDAGEIRMYVAIREKETALPSSHPAEPATYNLCRFYEVSPTDERVAYRAHGIALVAEREASKR
jgi:hypothetical protein